MIAFYYPDTLHSANRYKEAKKEAEKRSGKEKNDKNRVKMDYFEWLLGKIAVDPTKNEHIQGFKWLFATDFQWSHKLDANRAADGVDLRSTFAYEYGYSYPEVREALLDKQCSWLEMMVGLAMRCEDSIMGNDEFGDRTPHWFNVMIDSLGLYLDCSEDDEAILKRCAARKYEQDGEGGLWWVKGTKKNLRRMQIWDQMCEYLNTNYKEEIHL